MSIDKIMIRNWLKKVFAWPSTKRILPTATEENLAPSAQSAPSGNSKDYKNLADSYLEEGKLEDAASFYRKAIAIDPQYADAYSNLGLVLREQGRDEEAVRYLNQAISINPRMANAHYILGTIAQRGGNVNAAIDHFNRALEIKPAFETASRDLCYVLFQCGQNKEAMRVVTRGIHHNPDSADLHYYLGNLHRHENQPETAISCFQKALSIQPDYSEVHYNLGILLQERRTWNEALSHYKKAASDPNFIDAKWNYSHLSLLLGDYASGFEFYETRLEANQHPKFGFIRNVTSKFPARPHWRGEPLEDMVLLVWTEQGMGDSLMMLRYLPKLKERSAGRLVVFCEPDLVRIMRGLPGVDKVISKTDSWLTEDFDCHCSLMSMPYLFGTRLNTIPHSVPYFQVSEDMTAKWTKRLSQVNGIKIGLVWAGGKLTDGDAKRTLPLSAFGPLMQVPEVTFISLQKGEAALQLVEKDWPILDWMDECKDMLDTAGLVKSLDLVISVDTSVAHLAGALGKPVWLLNRFESEWRWLLDRDDSPWYPTMKIFRQPDLHSWDAVIDSVTTQITMLAASKVMI